MKTTLFPFMLAGALSSCFWACIGDSRDTGPIRPEYFPTSIDGLESAVPTRTLEARDGDTVVLTATAVKKVLRGREVRMLAYNGSIPGPLIKVAQGARITLRLRNRLGAPTTLHPHGLRLSSRSDGTSLTQQEIADGDSFDYDLTFPDPGPFWYHPHVRESYFLEMGLYGNFLVTPRDSAYWSPVNREVPVIFDDVLTDSAGIVKFRKDMADYAMMGRFGNVFLANGDTALTLTFRKNEVVRFYFTNACNARVLNLGLHVKDTSGVLLNREMKLVGSDMGRFETWYYPYYELLAPGERSVAEAWLFDTTTLYLNHTIMKPGMPKSHITLAVIKVLPDSVDTPFGNDYFRTDTSAHAIASIDSVRKEFDRPPDKDLLLTIRMDHSLFKIAHDPNGKGIDWEDHGVAGMDNAASNVRNTVWVVRDTRTGRENHGIDWSFKRGEKVMIRVYNDSTSMHPMAHPMHFHGQRFLVVNINGARNREMAWKDTYLVGRGETADILLDASNPGAWMMHCHITEHQEAMMMLNYRVE